MRQGDQIGRILAYWVIWLNIFYEKIAKHFGLLSSTVKVMYYFRLKNWTIIGTFFSQTHLVTLFA
jgi:hypothetical protein